MNKFFIVGCPRSGTTLLQRLLNRQRQIVVPPETAFAEFTTLRGRRQSRHWRRITDDVGIDLDLPPRGIRTVAAARQLYERMAQLYVERTGRTEIVYFGEKSPQHQRYLPLLWRLFPDAKVILICRDGRDVAISLSRLPWMPPDVDVNFALWLHYARIQRRLEQTGAPRLHVVQYERLVRSPESAVRDICEFLGLDGDASSLDRDPRAEGIPAWELPWKSDADAPITTERIGQWRQSLSAVQIARLERSGGKTLERLGYELSGDGRDRLPRMFLPRVYLKSLLWVATRIRFAEHRSMALGDIDIARRKRDFYAQMRPTPIPVDRGRLAHRWLPRAKRLLDVGCGPGNHLRHLARKVEAAVGVDIDFATLALARERITMPSVALLQYDGARLPFADRSFDAVTTLDVLEHVADRQAMVDEIARVLQPGGTWIVSVPHRGAFGWLSPENLAQDFAPFYGMLSRVARPRFWVRGRAAAAPRHAHFTLAELSELALSRFTRVRHARRGGLIYAIAYLAASFPPRGAGKLWTSACFGAMAIDYQLAYGPLAYNLAVELRRRPEFEAPT